MREPKQQRSELSLDRIVAAADRLVRENGFEKTSINMICAEAGLTSGAFYARFRDKEDLALALWRRFEPRTEAAISSFATALERGSLRTAVRSLLMEVVGLYERDGFLIREFVATARRHRDIADAMRESNERSLRQVIAIVRADATEIAHPRPELALRLGFVCIFNTLRELVLEREIFGGSRNLRPEILVSEMTRLLLSYLEY